jgi:exodeoxyribonuclease VII large subunit
MSMRGRPAPLPLPGSRRVFTVSEITRGIRNALEEGFGIVLVQGEVANYKGVHQPSGNHYFCLKDATSQIDVVLFSDRITRAVRDVLQNGIALQIEGGITVFEKTGRYQLRALRVEPVGYGALQARFEALKRKLELEGLFSPDRKRALPRYPTRIGLVTSASGAVIQDMLRVLKARAPYAQVVLADTRVQGEDASREIAATLDRMNARGGVDVIIVGRGGGSPQDLWAFNEEAVVRAIVRSKVPVVSGVGHETDFTLADFAADVRAATPTHAAQLVVKDIEEIRKTLATMSRDARKRIVAELEHARSRLQGYRNHHALREPERRIGDKMQELDRLQERLTRGLRGGVTLRRGAVQLLTTRLRSHSPGRSFARAYDRVESCRRSVLQAVATSLARHREGVASRMRLLDSFGPHRVLERGYALVWDEGGKALRKRGAELRAGDPIEVQFFDARAGARVTEVLPESATPDASGKETS